MEEKIDDELTSDELKDLVVVASNVPPPEAMFIETILEDEGVPLTSRGGSYTTFGGGLPLVDILVPRKLLVKAQQAIEQGRVQSSERGIEAAFSPEPKTPAEERESPVEGEVLVAAINDELNDQAHLEGYARFLLVAGIVLLVGSLALFAFTGVFIILVPSLFAIIIIYNSHVRLATATDLARIRKLELDARPAELSVHVRQWLVDGADAVELARKLAAAGLNRDKAAALVEEVKNSDEFRNAQDAKVSMGAIAIVVAIVGQIGAMMANYNPASLSLVLMICGAVWIYNARKTPPTLSAESSRELEVSP
jgi:hypothetical protein